ncbi:hypothetical protein JCM5353_003859 [Sporobolomyces roseus]
MNHFTTFILDLDAQNANLPLIIIYILPQLPNLRRFVCPKDRFLKSISPVLRSDPLPEKSAFTLSKLVQIARKISEWDIKLSNGLDYETIVFANPPAIRSLAVTSTCDEEFRLLGSEGTGFSRHLAQCTSLETLKLDFQNEEITPDYALCHADSLSLAYSFRHTLTSLEISVNYGSDPASDINDDSLIAFASSFANLRHLQLDGVNYSNVQGSSCSFPQLVHLGVFRMATFVNLESFLRGKSMPKLARLEVGFVDDYGLDLDVSEDTVAFELVAKVVNGFKPTLKSIHLHHKVGITETEIERFRVLIAGCQVYTSWRGGRTEVEYATDPGWYCAEEEAMHGMSKAIRKLGRWTVESVDQLERQRDVKGMSDLWKELNGVDEYRKWMED